MWFIIILIVLLITGLLNKKEYFQVVENAEIDIDEFSAVAETVVSSPKLKIRNKKIIQEIETSKESLEKANFVIAVFLEKLNKFSKSEWSLLELTNYSKKITGTNSQKMTISALITNKSNLVNIEFITNLTDSGKVSFEKIFLLTDSPQISYKSYDPKFSGNFQIKNQLGLLRPFPTSEPRLATEKDFEIALAEKSKPRTEAFCLDTEYKTEQDCLANNSVWDKPVISGHECPFFRANIHYPNKRGGSKGGFCELPSGMQLRGFRFVDPKAKPLCHNCKDGGVNTCCEDQLDPKKYPKLKGYPDYKFPGDELERKHYL